MSHDLMNAGVVRILGPGDSSVGTGFVITDEGLIATCAHVVGETGAKPGQMVRLIFHAAVGERQAEVLQEYWSEPHAQDIAILRLAGSLPEGVAPLPLGFSLGAEGSIFRTFGYPKAMNTEGLPGKCEVLGYTTVGGYGILALHSDEVSYGFSGAPLWDSDLQIVTGMVTSIVGVEEFKLKDAKKPLRIPYDPGGRQTTTAFAALVQTIQEVCPPLRLADVCPYRGLEVFEAEHAAYYFGREAETGKLLTMLTQRDFVAVVGVSGSGKSSLVRAGLKKGLGTWAVPGLAGRSRCLCRQPGHTPVLNLILALSAPPTQTSSEAGWRVWLVEDVARAFDLPLAALCEEGEARRQALERLKTRSPSEVAQALNRLALSAGLLLVVDQFERLYTECGDEDARSQFIEVLLAAASDEVKVIIALRADFYGLALDQKLAPAITAGQLTLLSMDQEQLKQAIVKPATALRRAFQPGLEERLMADVSGRAGDLPLLQFALAELWKQDGNKGVLTLESYERLSYTNPEGQRFPGVQGALAQWAEAVWGGLNEEERKAARRVFLGLVTLRSPAERGALTGTDVSRRAWQAELDEPAQRVVQKFADARLLATGHEPVSEQSTVEVAHEALIRAWPRLQQWVTDYYPFVRWYEHDLLPSLRLWLDKDKKDSGFLLPESLISTAMDWLSSDPTELSGPPEEFIRASSSFHDERRQREHAINERLTAALKNEEAERILAERNAVEARSLLWATRAQQTEDPSLAIALALTANRIESPPTFVQQVLAEVAYRPGMRRHLAAGHRGRVWSVAFQSGYALSGSEDGVVILWDIATGKEVRRLEGHTGSVWGVALSADGRFALSGSSDHSVIFWNTETRKSIHRLEGHKDNVSSVALSADGQLGLSGSVDRSLILWRTITGEPIKQLNELTSPVRSVALSSDGRIAVAALDNGNAIGWNTETGRVVHALGDSDSSVSNVAISADGFIAAVGSERSLLLWYMETGEVIERFTGHTDLIQDVALSADGCTALTCAADRSLVVWDTERGDLLLYLVGHNKAVRSVALTCDGRFALSGSEDSSMIKWDLENGQLLKDWSMGGYIDINCVALSMDGTLAFAANDLLQPYFWNTEIDEFRSFGGHTEAVMSVALSADGRTGVSGVRREARYDIPAASRGN